MQAFLKDWFAWLLESARLFPEDERADRDPGRVPETV